LDRVERSISKMMREMGEMVTPQMERQMEQFAHQAEAEAREFARANGPAMRTRGSAYLREL